MFNIHCKSVSLNKGCKFWDPTVYIYIGNDYNCGKKILLEMYMQ
jgi:hypothetical protein